MFYVSILVTSLPMRNWNTLFHSLQLVLLTVTSLPMRNWNATSCHPLPQSRSVTSLPMRNWNLNIPCRTTSVGNRYQPTYEELKQVVSRFKTIRLDGLPAYLWGIETPEALQFWWTFYLLPAYLWGIETSQCSPSTRLARWLPAYLWGIETQSHYEAANIAMGYQPTYEELKP